MRVCSTLAPTEKLSDQSQICQLRITGSIPSVWRLFESIHECVNTSALSRCFVLLFLCSYYIKESKGSKRWLLFLEGEDEIHLIQTTRGTQCSYL